MLTPTRTRHGLSFERLVLSAAFGAWLGYSQIDSGACLLPLLAACLCCTMHLPTRRG